MEGRITHCCLACSSGRETRFKLADNESDSDAAVEALISLGWLNRPENLESFSARDSTSSNFREEAENCSSNNFHSISTGFPCVEYIIWLRKKLIVKVREDNKATAASMQPSFSSEVKARASAKLLLRYSILWQCSRIKPTI